MPTRNINIMIYITFVVHMSELTEPTATPPPEVITPITIRVLPRHFIASPTTRRVPRSPHICDALGALLTVAVMAAICYVIYVLAGGEG